MTRNANGQAGGKHGAVALALAAILFAVYFANVAAGAAGLGVYISNVNEVIILFASVTCFVVGILEREARANAARSKNTPKDQGGTNR